MLKLAADPQLRANWETGQCFIVSTAKRLYVGSKSVLGTPEVSGSRSLYDSATLCFIQFFGVII
ncbi:MAG: hypothetical protein A2431_01410 [Candidatus Zambryskibacteria bacterium RIFOXYC1_FULL_39_10]|uniref:Uncharacterized protein n=1 Tax=Candidatus Zambryskibacteria bacterium RIFOXYC1_FULL_39_10 TaxID=1802779 RepID=A0A1G2V426_9BACT|nr:MAG: hypothetical protein A2431_01410 [Candidatus Zambryskibacteria bacterium RIFOXYC1_FULL_39_10]